MPEAERSARRNHALKLKTAVLDQCHAGASVASVAMAHGLNANLVHKWRRLAQGQLVAATTPLTPAPKFIPLATALPTPTPPAYAEPRELRIELRRGAIVATETGRCRRRLSARHGCASCFDDPHQR
jgi:transposase